LKAAEFEDDYDQGSEKDLRRERRRLSDNRVRTIDFRCGGVRFPDNGD
jgi:hypothetical protein